MNLHDLVSRIEAGEPVRLRVPEGSAQEVWGRRGLVSGTAHAPSSGSGSERVRMERALLREPARLHSLPSRSRPEVLRVSHSAPSISVDGVSAGVFRDERRYAIGGGELGSQGVESVEMRAHSVSGTGVKGRLVAAISEFVDVHVSGAIGGHLRSGVL